MIIIILLIYYILEYSLLSRSMENLFIYTLYNNNVVKITITIVIFYNISTDCNNLI